MTNQTPRRLRFGIRLAKPLRRNRSGRADATGDAPVRIRNGQSRSRRSRNWAVGLAVGLALVASLPIVVGAGWNVIVTCFVVLGLAVGLSYTNMWTAGWMNDNLLRAVSMRRLAVAFVLAVFVATGATLWLFDAEVRTVQAERDPAGWAKETRRLRAERTDDTKILAEPVPDVYQDRDVIRLQQELATAKTELDRAENDLLCELDGTCGTRVPGKADAYYEKKDYRDKLLRQVADLKDELAQAKDLAAGRAATVEARQSRARDRLHRIDERLDQLGSVPPTPPWRLRALFTITERDPGPVGGVFAGAFFGFIALDWGVLMVVLYLFRRRTDENLGSIAAKVDRRAERSARDIKNFDDLPPRMRDTYDPPSGGE